MCCDIVDRPRTFGEMAVSGPGDVTVGSRGIGRGYGESCVAFGVSWGDGSFKGAMTNSWTLSGVNLNRARGYGSFVCASRCEGVVVG